MAKRKKRQFKIVVFATPVILIIAALAWYLHRHTVAVLEPAGPIAQKERNLMVFAVLLAAIVLIPVYVLTIMIALKYNEKNHEEHKVKYSPDWDHSRLFESLWWGIPVIIIAVLSVVTWNSSHALDPYKPLDSSVQPITVQVVALDWKWLFIYPSQHIASVNLVEMPVNTPVNFQLTSDTVMNSFWVPQLSGQIYAMPGMSTQLHMMADKTGSFYGSPANISGAGFARMTFTVRSVSSSNFSQWVHTAQTSSNQMNVSAYISLSKPSDSNPVVLYSHAVDGLYNQVIMKYMGPSSTGMAM